MTKNLFTASPEELKLIEAISKRAKKLYKAHGQKVDLIDIIMDLEATQCNGCTLCLQELLEADDFNLMHDVCGINRHLNRETGELERFFLPRFAAAEKDSN